MPNIVWSLKVDTEENIILEYFHFPGGLDTNVWVMHNFFIHNTLSIYRIIHKEEPQKKWRRAFQMFT